MGDTTDVAQAATTSIGAIELQTRFLYPFFFQPRCGRFAADALTALRVDGKHVWTQGAPSEFYKQELLPAVADFLFGGDPGSCSYLRLSPAVAKLWFPPDLVVDLPHHQNAVPIWLVSDLHAEFFLSPYGAGVLSIALSPKLNRMQVETLEPAMVLDFNYRLAQLRRRKAPRLVNLGQTSKDRVDQEDRVQQGASELHGRIAATGGSYLLDDLRDLLVSPLQQLELKRIQMQFSAYTVVRFAGDIDFGEPAIRKRLGPLLAGLTQIEESTHAGAKEQAMPVSEILLNQNHWCAVGSLASAHLISDQAANPFNKQRMATVRDKYFIAYLLSLLQQIALRRIATVASHHVRVNMAARGAVPDETDNEYRSPSRSAVAADSHRSTTVSYCQPVFRTCVAEMHELSVNGCFSEPSVREVINRYYRQCQDSLQIPRMYSEVKEKINGVDSACRTERAAEISAGIDRNLDTVARIQNKIEWVEILIVSFYAMELTTVLGHNFHFEDRYIQWAGIAVVTISTAIIAYVLQPWRHDHGQVVSPQLRQRKAIAGFMAILLMIVAYWIAGMAWPKSANDHGHQPPASGAAELQSRLAGAGQGTASNDNILSFQQARPIRPISQIDARGRRYKRLSPKAIERRPRAMIENPEPTTTAMSYCSRPLRTSDTLVAVSAQAGLRRVNVRAEVLGNE